MATTTTNKMKKDLNEVFTLLSGKSGASKEEILMEYQNRSLKPGEKVSVMARSLVS
jgi:hypothetical protein